MNTQLKIIVTITIISLLMLPVHAIAQPCGGYEVTAIVSMDECPPFGIPPVVPFGINEQGWMVGFFQPCVIGPDTAFLWTPEDGLVVIPMPAGTTQSRALAISGSKVVGYHVISGDEFGNLGFLYDYATDEFTSLGSLPGGNWSEAHAINSKGEIVGFWGDTVQGPSPLAFIWRDGEMIDINPDFGTLNSEANGINANSVVTGWLGSSTLSDARAYIWDKGKVTELPFIPGGSTSEGRAINDQGDVAGRGLFFDSEINANVWRAFAFIDGEAINLGTLQGIERSIATGINDDKIVVGFLFSPGTTAFIWRDGKMTALNDLISPSEGLSIDLARGINQNGQIATQGHSDPLDATVGVMLSPIVGLPGDLDSDCRVTIADLLLLLGNWGPCNGCPADLDDNGIVNVSDLLILFSNWG